MKSRFAQKRKSSGSALTEFGPALAIFVVFFFVPLLDLGFIPVRYGTAYGAINQYVHGLSRCEKISDVANHLGADQWWRGILAKCGVGIDNVELALRIVSKNNADRKIVVPFPSPVPAAWLPNGGQSPCIYYLQLTVNTHIAPMFSLNLGGVGVPGLTESAPFTFTASAAWENLGRDPDTGSYFLTE